MKTVTIAPQEGPQTAFLASDADVVIYGGGAGGGKSWALLLEDLYYKDDPNFSSVTFRRTYPQIIAPGGLWEDSQTLYGKLKAKPSVDPLQWRWPSGAISRFAQMQYEADMYNWQGSQIPLIKFDELTHFSQRAFFYMLSRNRSASGVPTRIRGTCNADADSWVAVFIAWWINQKTGHPIPERVGVIRYFARDGDKIVWADDPLDLPRIVVEGKIVPPKTATFIPATVYDNKILLRNDPGYVATLHSLDFVERERLLGNNWKIRYTSGSMFKEEWYASRYVQPDDPRLKRLETVYRAWDTAATPVTDSQGNVVAFEDAPKNKPNDPDWTVGVKMGLITSTETYTEEGVVKKRLRRDYFVLDVVRVRGTPLDVENAVRDTARKDGRSVKIFMEQEPGASGVQAISHFKRNVVNGYVFEGVRPSGPKITRAKAFSADSEHGYIWIVEGLWNDPYLTTVCAFPNPKVHDDDVDASSLAHDRLKNRKHAPQTA